MMGLRLLAFAFAAAAIVCTPARAATTVFGASVFSQSGTVNNIADALGPADGAGARIRLNATLVLQFGAPASGAGLVLDSLNSGRSNTAAVSIGEIVNGVAVFSTPVSFVETTGGPFNFDLSAQCAAISATGCSLIRIQTIATNGSPGFVLDGASGVSAAPEPETWMLLGIGFIAMALRRRNRRNSVR